MTARVRVAVTGIGVKSPVGNDIQTFWSGLCAGRPTGRRLAILDGMDVPVDFGCEVTGFDPADYLDAKTIRRTDRTTQLGFASAADAIADARLTNVDPTRCAVVAGSGQGGTKSLEDEFYALAKGSYHRVNPNWVPMIIVNATAALVSIRYNYLGPSLAIATACTSGAHAVGEGARLIREGSADIAVVGGAESPLAPLTISAFALMGALSRRGSDPEHASRPFDIDRDGFVIGEGAGFLVLERWDHAVARGAHIHAELTGYGRNSDGYHMTAPSPEGAGARSCMELALRDAGITPDDVVHINAHGTSTPLNDVTEARAINQLFGSRDIPVTSSKGSTGHLVGAAGAVEAVAAVMAVREGLAHPTANHAQRDPKCDIDVVSGKPRKIPQGPVISNSFGFGGHNATLVFAPSSW
jgi:3-oxoacyl-[acyl-carrier-protein] synthase II